MKKSNLTLLLSLVATLSVSSPSWADTGHGGGDSNLNTVVDGSLIVTRVGGAATAAVIGTPIACVRETYKLYTTWTPQWADKVGGKVGGNGKDCGPTCAVVSLVSVPAAIVWGTCLGTFHGAKNGLVKGFNTPFKPDTFSIGKDYEE